jgi:hypothetical protein
MCIKVLDTKFRAVQLAGNVVGVRSHLDHQSRLRRVPSFSSPAAENIAGTNPKAILLVQVQGYVGFFAQRRRHSAAVDVHLNHELKMRKTNKGCNIVCMQENPTNPFPRSSLV